MSKVIITEWKDNKVVVKQLNDKGKVIAQFYINFNSTDLKQKMNDCKERSIFGTVTPKDIDDSIKDLAKKIFEYKRK